MPPPDRTRLRQLQAEYESRGDALGWFEALYREAAGNTATIPWADRGPSPHLVASLGSTDLGGSVRSSSVAVSVMTRCSSRRAAQTSPRSTSRRRRSSGAGSDSRRRRCSGSSRICWSRRSSGASASRSLSKSTRCRRCRWRSGQTRSMPSLDSSRLAAACSSFAAGVTKATRRSDRHGRSPAPSWSCCHARPARGVLQERRRRRRGGDAPLRGLVHETGCTRPGAGARMN